MTHRCTVSVSTVIPAEFPVLRLSRAKVRRIEMAGPAAQRIPPHRQHASGFAPARVMTLASFGWLFPRN